MLDTSYHRRRSERRMADPEYREAYDRARAQIEQINGVIRSLDEMREHAGLSKAALARRINRNDAVVRRLFTAEVNPELRLVAEIASALGARVEIVKDSSRRRKRSLAASA